MRFRNRHHPMCSAPEGHGSGHRGHGHGRRHRGGKDWTSERGGRGGRRVLDSGELRLVLLRLIAEQPRHGYDLIRAIEDMTGGAYAPSPGIVYPALSMMEDMGQTAETQSEGNRKVFAATPEGSAELEKDAEKADALVARLAAMAEERERIDAAPIRRAMDNLHMAVRNRLGEESATRDTVHEAAAILDEAAQRIERL